MQLQNSSYSNLFTTNLTQILLKKVEINWMWFVKKVIDISKWFIQARGGVESNEFRIDFYQIFRIIFHLSNQSNHKFSNRIERISNESSIWKIWLHPIVGVESNEFQITFHRTFRIFLALVNRNANFGIELNEFRTNSNLTPPLKQTEN